MKKILQVIRWVLISAAALMLSLAVGVGFYARTEHFRRLVQDQLIGAINESIRGSVSLGRVEGTFWGDVILHNVRVRYRDNDIVNVPRLRISFSLLPLLRGRVRISRAEAVEPVFHVTRDRQGRWNIVEAFTSDDEEPSRLAIILNAVSLRRANIDVILADAEPDAYHLTGLNLRGRLTIEPGGLSVEVREVSFRLKGLEIPELNVEGALAYQDTKSPPTFTMTDFSVDSGASRIKLNGRITDLDKPELEIKAALEKLAASDTTRFVPEWPLKHDLSGTLDLSGPPDGLKTTVQLAVAGAQLTGRLNLNIAQKVRVYYGTINVVEADARKLLDQNQFAGVVSGEIKVEGRGFSLDEIDAGGNLAIRSAEAGGWALGNASLNVRMHQNTISLDGKLKGELGGADWRGQFTLAKIPRYEMEFAVRDLDIKSVSAEDITMGGQLNFKGKIKGTGLKISDMSTQTEIEILPSSVGPVQVQQGRVSASIASGRIRITQGALQTADATLMLKGDIGTNIAQRGTLDYELRAQNLTPWLSLVGRNGAGSLELSGRAQGSLADLTTWGTVKVAGARLDEVSAKEGRIDFNLTTGNKRPWPTGTVRAALIDLEKGIQLRKVDAAVELAPELARFDVKARDQWNRAHTLAGDIRWLGKEVIALLGNLSLELPDGIWKLAQPVTIKTNGEEFFIDNAALRNGVRSLSITGRLAAAGRQDLTLGLENFPLVDLAAFLPRQPNVTGVLAAQAQVGGTAAAPEIRASLKLGDSTIAGQAYAGLLADAVYQDRTASLKILVRQDADHILTANATLPLALSWQDGWRSELKDAVDVRAQSKGLSLSFLNAFLGKSVDDVAGEISLDVMARGSIKEPVLGGTWRLRGGKLKAIPLGVNISDIAAAGILDSRSIRIQSLSAQALEGRLSGQGSLALKNYQLDNFALSLLFNKWPALQTRRYQAQLQGNVDLQGSWQAPRMKGNLEVVEANLRPDLEFLEKSATPATRDETIVIVKGKDPNSALNKKAGEEGQSDESQLWKRASLDIDLRMPGNVWVRHPDGVADLRGNFRILKKAYADIDLTGAAEIIHGWVGFQGRRFDLSRGHIVFAGGGKINPALDIVARHRLPQYQVEAVVSGTAEQPELTLRSQPPLDQADILSLILFGKPTKDLNRGEQASLQQNAQNLATGYFAGEIMQSISSALGLGNLGIDLGDVSFNGGKIGFGRYVGQETYVEMSQELDGEKGRKVGVEYQLAPDWKIGTSTDTRGSSGVEIIWSKQY
jgi:autotransporter translocation and assembly factor TamB